MMSKEALIIRDVTKVDVKEASALAHRIWRQHYTPIIGSEQVEYMLARNHTVPAYDKLLEEGRWQFKIALIEETMVGFMIHGVGSTPGKFFVQSLYVDENHQGKGIGKQFLNTIEQRPLVLRVNKYNTDSIAFYKHYGFEVKSENVWDIGGGFSMDDYIMQCES